MGYLLVFLMISVLILIHEFGHFCAAKWAGIPIRQFSIGYGPRLFGFMVNGTEYRISAFPVGGYVLPEIEQLDDYFAFSFRSRVLFALAGPAANVLAAWGGLVIICLLRDGFSLAALSMNPLIELWTMTAGFVASIPVLFSHPDQLSGIVGLVAVGGREIGVDLPRLLYLSVMLNINLAFLNLLPILPLDGGKILVDVLGRLQLPVRRIYVPVAISGWVVLLILMVYITIQDVSGLVAVA